MKLAEALINRANNQRRLEELRQRILRNAKYQEGETPAEDPLVLVGEYDTVSAELESLIVAINRTNQAAALEDGKPMIEALAERDMLKKRHELYKALADAATPKQDRYSKKEIRFVSAVDVATIQREADDIARAYRLLDMAVQQANWIHELKE